MRKKKLQEKKRLYTDKQISEAYDIVRERLLQVVSILGKYANVISYAIAPDQTAIGASLRYNIENFDNRLYQNVACNPDLAFDGNRGFTLLALAEMIKNGEL